MDGAESGLRMARQFGPTLVENLISALTTRVRLAAENARVQPKDKDGRLVHHHGQKRFETREKTETSALVKRSDAVLKEKLRKFYGDHIPTSTQLWN